MPEYYDAPVGRSRRPPSPPVTVEPHDGPLGVNFGQRYPDGREDLLTAHRGIEANSLQLSLEHTPAGDGVVAKHRHSPYRGRRSDRWVKVKHSHGRDLVAARDRWRRAR